MHPNKDIAVVQWNCRGLKPNYEEIKRFMHDFNPLVFCLQETFLGPTDNITFRYYNIFNKCSSSLVDGRPIGGSTILIKKGTPHEIIKIQSNLQVIAAKVTLHCTFTICSIYIPPRFELTQGELDRLVDQLPEPFLLVGDLNAHSPLWGCQNLDRLGKIVEQMIDHFDLCILNSNTMTYIHPASGSKTAIDLSVCSPTIFMDFQWNVHNDQCGSDHFPILIETVRCLPEERTPKWQLLKANWVDFSKQCSNSINQEKFRNKENSLNSFSHTLIDIATNTIPKSNSSLRKHNPWFNTDCKEAVKCRKKTLRKFQKHPNNDNLQKYREARAKARNIIKKAKRESWKSYISKLNIHTPINKVWEMVKKISGKHTSNPVPFLSKADGTKCTERLDIVNLLAQEFEHNSSTNHYSPVFQAYKGQAEKGELNFASNNTEDYNIPFNITELKDSLNKSHDTATGPDDIHYQFLKHLPDESLLVVLDIFNSIWRTGVFPDSWREATIIPIPKPGKDASKPTNYRPISLTSCLCKTMERMINTRLVWLLEKKGLITRFQSGFRQNRSTVDQLIRLESYIRDGIIRGHHVVSIFFDLEKAYDTTWKYGIMRDLYNVGLRGKLPIFIRNFLSNRVFRVRLGSSLSELHNQEMGVPQGSILSVTLFLLKINSIVDVVTPRFDRSLFVDDFCLSCSSENMDTIETTLQNCLYRIEKWADENGFRFSKTKTVCVHFCNKRSLHPDPELKINGSIIPVSQQAKYLGLIFDNRLNFKAHIDYLRERCIKSLNLLKVVSRMDWGADRIVLLRLYRSLIRSKLDYGSAVYSSARKSYLEKLKPIQNQGLRICLGAFRTSPMESLYVEANEPPLHLRYEKLSLSYAIKLKNNTSNPTYDITFRPRHVGFYNLKPSSIKSFGLRIQGALIHILNNTSISPFLVPKIPPWMIFEPVIDLTLKTFKKGFTSDLVYLDKFGEIRHKYRNFQAIYTDGSKDENKVGSACISNNVQDQVRLPDSASIYTAELLALKMALHIVENTNKRHFVIFTDSLSSLMALQCRNLKHPFVVQLLESLYKLDVLCKKVVFAWIPSHTGIKGNEKADKLAKEALKLEVTKIQIPYTDLKSKINIYIRRKWQTSWDLNPVNKLYQHQSVIKPHNTIPLTKRRDDIVLTRVRIGHSHLTHSYLLAAEELPRCVSCDCVLSVKHILIECVEFSHIRTNFYDVPDLKTLFCDVSRSRIVDFLKEINLFLRFKKK